MFNSCRPWALIVLWIQKYRAAAVVGWLSVISVRNMAARNTDKWSSIRSSDEMKVKKLNCTKWSQVYRLHTHTQTQQCQYVTYNIHHDEVIVCGQSVHHPAESEIGKSWSEHSSHVAHKCQHISYDEDWQAADMVRHDSQRQRPKDRAYEEHGLGECGLPAVPTHPVHLQQTNKNTRV